MLQQFLAVVLQRLISRVRHDEKPSLIGDAGKGHGRPGGGGGGARGGTASLGGRVREKPRPLAVGPASLLHLSFLGLRRALKEASDRTAPCWPGWVKQGAVILVIPRDLAVLQSLLCWNHKRLCNKLSSE